MIEKIGLRAAEFVGSTARRVAGAAESVVSDSRKPKHRLAKVAVPAVAAGAAAVAAAASGIVGDRAGSSRPSSSSRSPRSSPSRSNGRAGATREVKDKANSAAEKTRDELYELAKKADIPGRSSMSKEELAKALGK